eukprot:CAMPEP_0118929362 /NCGR_PEP_ID=MMETSP1169-20130426/6385_1 /TAXON_ID=36882 /ORGANISM="Pyramimonas obovata, Strain CCMP722" /LENGTH=159 /DNA_ID=CAMNT_0006871535 /DNA_START=227 /DNA_END=703 /DNA_ORIENTATION=+
MTSLTLRSLPPASSTVVRASTNGGPMAIRSHRSPPSTVCCANPSNSFEVGIGDDKLDSGDLRRFVEANNVAATFTVLSTATHTVTATAEALGINAEHVIKSILLCVDESLFVLVLAAGTRKIQLSKVAAHLRIPRRKIRLASHEEVKKITGYSVGTVPP